MDNDFWTKITHYKLFGFIIFTKEEICSEMQYEGQIYQVSITSDYYDSEFKIDDEKKKK